MKVGSNTFLMVFLLVAIIVTAGCSSENRSTATPVKEPADKSKETVQQTTVEPQPPNAKPWNQTIQPIEMPKNKSDKEDLQPQPPTELKLKVGETAKTSKIEVTVFSVKKNTAYEYYSDIFKDMKIQDASPGKTYVLIEAEIKNVGSDSVFVGSGSFSVGDSEGYKYDSTLYYGDDRLGFQELYQNQKMKGKVLFEVPENAKGLKSYYDFGNLFIGTKLASWDI